MKKHGKIPTIQALYEEEFGDEISKINDWFSEKYDESYQFKWDGKTLKVLDGDEKEMETLSREDLVKEIDGFPTNASEALTDPKFATLKELNDEIDNFLARAYDNGEDVAKIGKEIKDNIDVMLKDL